MLILEFNKEYGNNFYENKLHPKIIKIIRYIIDNISKYLLCYNKKECYQFLTFDFIIDNENNNINEIKPNK